jgi:predicted nucleic acid-binding protein
VLKDEKEARADALLHQWATSLTQMLGPPLFLPESTNALYLSVRRQRLILEEAKLALEAIMHIGVEVTEPPELYSRSLDVAAKSGLTNAYDAQYIALAEIEGCELWTADERLAIAMKPSPSWLRVV